MRQVTLLRHNGAAAPMPNAVDCDTPLGACCPKGYSCNKAGSGWEVVVTCVPDAAGDATNAVAPDVPGSLQVWTDRTHEYDAKEQSLAILSV